MYFGKRYYSPELGRFWTTDPKGLSENPNLYQYVRNNLLLNFDLYGLEGLYYGHPAPQFDWAKNAIAQPQVQGTLQAVGGVAEISAGLGVSMLSGGIATPIGWFAIAHGFDQTLAGMRTVWSGKFQDTASVQLVQKTGLSHHNAQLINDCVSTINIIGNAAVINAARSAIGNLKYSPISQPQKTIYNKNIKHIFRDVPGHIQDSVTNRKLLIETASNPHNFLGTDRFGNTWHAMVQSDGKQVWTQSRGTTIRNAGINPKPRCFSSITGLSKETK